MTASLTHFNKCMITFNSAAQFHPVSSKEERRMGNGCLPARGHRSADFICELCLRLIRSFSFLQPVRSGISSCFCARGRFLHLSSFPFQGNALSATGTLRKNGVGYIIFRKVLKKSRINVSSRIDQHVFMRLNGGTD